MLRNASFWPISRLVRDPNSCSEMPHFGLFRNLFETPHSCCEILILAYFETCSGFLILASKCLILAYFETCSGFLILAPKCLILAYFENFRNSSFLFRNALFRPISRFVRDSQFCLLYTSPSPRDKRQSRMPSSA